MTGTVYDWIGEVLRKYAEIRGKVLEVGAYNVNGTVRDWFEDKGRFPVYWGVDMQAGPGVDEVMTSHALDLIPNSWDVVVSAEMLEHDSMPFRTLEEMARVIKQDGWLILTARGIGFPKHGYPSDYWRFTGEGLKVLAESAGFKAVEVIEAEDQGVFGVFRS